MCNPGGMQWESDLIGYDAYSAYGTPSYYAQVLFAGHVGTRLSRRTCRVWAIAFSILSRAMRRRAWFT